MANIYEGTLELIGHSTERHPQAGKLWFERMKADHKEDILKGAMAIAMGRNNNTWTL